MVKHPAAVQRQPLTFNRLARHGEQWQSITKRPAEWQSGIQQGGAYATSASIRGDHADEFWRLTERIDPKEADQPFALPPQHVLDSVAASGAKIVPLQFQPAAVRLDHLLLKLGDRLQSL